MDHVVHTACILDSSTTKFLATNLETVGLAAARVSEHFQGTTNRIVYISSFETSFNEVLNAYKKATGMSDWAVEMVDSKQKIKDGGRKLRLGNLEGMEKVARAVLIQEGSGQDLDAEGLLENELLSLTRGNVDETVARVLKGSVDL